MRTVLRSSTEKLVVINTNVGSSPYLSGSSTALGAGNVRWNSVTQSLEVYDGYAWLVIGGQEYQIGFPPAIEQTLKWAEQKMMEDQRIKELSDKYPALKDAKEKFEILYTLITSGGGE